MTAESAQTKEEQTPATLCESCSCHAASLPPLPEGKSRLSPLAGWIPALAGVALFATALFAGKETSMGVAFYLAAYLLIGRNILLGAAGNLFRGKVMDENLLMTVATLGALALGEYTEAVSVLLFFLIGETLQEKSVRKSRASIAGLMDLKQDYAHLLREDALQTVSPADVHPGDLIMVRPGEKIPLDGLVTKGRSHLDTSTITGEFLFQKAEPGSEVLSGCINREEALTIKVTRTWDESTVSRILKLVQESAERKTRTETFIRQFARWYTPAVLILAALIAALTPLLFPIGWAEGVRRALILLIISCPCALVISIPLSYFAGIGRFARSGILLKGSNYLDALAHVDTVLFDKTGTLTEGKFAITQLLPAEGYTDTHLLHLAALAENASNHPIAKSIREAVEADGAIPPQAASGTFQEIAGRGTSFTTGENIIRAGNALWMQENGITLPPLPPLDATVVHIAENTRYAGSLALADRIKPDSPLAVEELRALGVSRIALLTGDSESHARAVGESLHLDNCYAQLLPQDKVRLVEQLQQANVRKKLLAFVGDGINDAPALPRADIGVSLGSMGSDAAMEASDVVLMTGEPSRLALAIRLARATRRIILQNIVFILGVKGAILLMAATGEASMWEAIFADVGVSLLAVLNAVRPVKTKPGRP